MAVGASVSRNFTCINDLSRTELLALSAPDDGRRCVPPPVRGTLAFLFEQASLRTKSSFAAAAVRVGLAPVTITTTGGAFRDQCDLVDELHQACLTSDCVVVRSDRPLDSAALAGSAAPIVNAGDGSNQHPTQTLVDLAVMRSFGLEGKTVAIIGNLRDHRTTHSLAMALGRLPARLHLVTPGILAMSANYIPAGAEVLTAETRPEVDAVLGDADFVYLPPIRYWNAPDLDFFDAYGFNLQRAERVLKPTARIMHPFPRFAELDRDLDGSRFDAYHMQTRMGPLVRERVLRLLLPDVVH